MQAAKAHDVLTDVTGLREVDGADESVETLTEPASGALADLARIARQSGEFCTAYLRNGPMLAEVFDALTEGRDAPAVSVARRALLAEAPASTPTVAVIAGADDAIVRGFDAPIRDDVVRIGPVTSAGTWLEFLQMMPTHLIAIAVDTDGDATADAERLVLHEFGAGDHGLRGEILASGSVDEIVSAVRFRSPDLMTVVAPADRHDELGPRFAEVGGGLALHLRDDPGSDDELVDQLVRHEADHRARRVTGAIAEFRQAELAGLCALAGAAIRAITNGRAMHLIVHDNPDDDRQLDGRRLVDDAVHRALANGVTVTVIPDAAAGSGPTGNIGAILSA